MKKKKIEKPTVKNEYTKASQEKLAKGIKMGNNDAIAERLRRAGIWQNFGTSLATITWHYSFVRCIIVFMITFKCYLCQKEKTVYPSYIKARKKMGIKHLFCSRKCFAEWLKTQEGYWKGKKMPFIKRNKHINGEMNPNWKGGRRLNKDGYVLILKKEHPNSDTHGYVLEHRLVMEKILKRYLLQEEVVHHVNHKKSDNRPENLILYSNGGEHQKEHYKNGDSKLKHAPKR